MSDKGNRISQVVENRQHIIKHCRGKMFTSESLKIVALICTGYVVMNMQEKKLQRKNSRGYYTITLWETVLQSPYSVDFTEEQARYQIHEDLMQHEDGKEWALSRIGICEKPDPKFCDPFEYNEIMENENVLVRYQLRANYQARRGEKTGFWDIILVHQKPIPQVPKDMRP